MTIFIDFVILNGLLRKIFDCWKPQISYNVYKLLNLLKLGIIWQMSSQYKRSSTRKSPIYDDSCRVRSRRKSRRKSLLLRWKWTWAKSRSISTIDSDSTTILILILTWPCPTIISHSKDNTSRQWRPLALERLFIIIHTRPSLLNTHGKKVNNLFWVSKSGLVRPKN